jgi:hypothetical protein
MHTKREYSVGWVERSETQQLIVPAKTKFFNVKLYLFIRVPSCDFVDKLLKISSGGMRDAFLQLS